MRVLALGGCGGMGRYASRAVIALDEVDELVIADLDGDRAARFAAELGPKAAPAAVDVSDEAALRRTLATADVVLNTVGPFFRFGLPVLTAALESGCDYLDICDDWEPTEEMLELGDRAARNGRRAVIGVGASPGISNLLAVVAARELDTVSDVVTGWNLAAAQPEPSASAAPSAALAHGLRQMTGTIAVVRDGRRTSEPALRPVRIDYPGLGRRRSRTFGHPEPLTLAGHYGLRGSVNAVHADLPTMLLMNGVRWATDHRVLSTRRALHAAAWLERTLPAPAPTRLFHPRRLPPLFAVATGTAAGRPASAGAALCRMPGATMGALTGIPLAVALGLLIAGKITGHGVMPPEAAIDPDDFFALLARHCPGDLAAADLIAITRSADPDRRAAFESFIGSARSYVGDNFGYGRRG